MKNVFARLKKQISNRFLFFVKVKKKIMKTFERPSFTKISHINDFCSAQLKEDLFNKQQYYEGDRNDFSMICSNKNKINFHLKDNRCFLFFFIQRQG
jgi:hypothetical protein